MCERFIPSSPNPISPNPISPEFFPFRHFFRPFQLRPFSIICPALLLLCLISFPPIFHFAKKPSRPTFPFRPMTISPFSHKAPSHFAPKNIFQISGPKSNKKCSNKLIPEFWTLFLGLLWTANIIGEEDILLTLCFFYRCGYIYDDAYFWEFLGIQDQGLGRFW